LLLLLVSIAHTQNPFECRGQYFLSLTKPNRTTSELYEVKIDPDGKMISLDTVNTTVGMILNAMGYRITDNFIYGMDPVAKRLRRVGGDGVAQDLGIPQGIPTAPIYFAGDITPDGRYLLLIGLRGVSQIVKVDLDDPNYRCTFVPLSIQNPGIVDIAFDPFTGVLYGHDFNLRRLVTIDPNTGTVNTSFPVQPEVGELGALFFDSFGNLYGYGSFGSPDQNKFVSINKSTGSIQLLAQGPNSSGQDGCSCPYTIDLLKSVSVDSTVPCSEVVYTFTLSNASGSSRSGINLFDNLPRDLVPKSILSNPFGGNVVINGNNVSITNMTVPQGIDSIKLLVEVTTLATGTYQNQATLTGLPNALGGSTVSDNPKTLAVKDSTPLKIIPFDLTHIQEDLKICKESVADIDISLQGVKYLWSDGSTQPRRQLTGPQQISVVVNSLCETKQLNFNIEVSDIEVDIMNDYDEIILGDVISLNGFFSSDEEVVRILWSQVNNADVECNSCLNTFVTPINDGFYNFSVINSLGCRASDEIFIRVKKEREVFYPNIIKLDQEGPNSKMLISGRNAAAEGITFNVFDRWGNKLHNISNFTLNSLDHAWDGTHNGSPVEEGVYVWKALIRYIDGFEQYYSGTITVLR
jgi:hypothetical protein